MVELRQMENPRARVGCSDAFSAGFMTVVLRLINELLLLFYEATELWLRCCQLMLLLYQIVKDILW